MLVIYSKEQYNSDYRSDASPLFRMFWAWMRRYPDQITWEPVPLNIPKAYSYIYKFRALMKAHDKLIAIDDHELVELSSLSRLYKMRPDMIIKCIYKKNPSYTGFNVSPFAPPTKYTFLNFNKIQHRFRRYRKKPEYLVHCSLNRPKSMPIQQMRHILSACPSVVYTSNSQTPVLNYFCAISNSQFVACSASAGSKAPATGRDFEAMALGVPTFRLKHSFETAEPLISGVHYYGFDTYEEIARFVSGLKSEYNSERYRSIAKEAYEWFRRNISVAGSFNLFNKIVNGS